MQIAIKKGDGSIAIMTLLGDAEEAANLAPEHLATIVDAELVQWPETDRDAVVSWRVIEEADVPNDRKFRAAWSLIDEGISVDMPKARQIWKDILRQARTPKLKELDIKFQRALEDGGGTKAIVAAKNELRQVTDDPRIEAATTPEELMLAVPEVLRNDV